MLADKRKRYAVELHNQQLARTVRAHTKGEARKFFKLMAHIAPKNRLPFGYKVIEVPV